MRKALLIIALLASAGCATTELSDGSLYQALGGKETLERVSGRFVASVGEDPKIRPFFLHTNLERFHEKFALHLCQISGGPCEYDGDSMVEVHIGMDINEADFNRVVEMLIDAMEAEGIPQTAQNRLLARLAPLREDIIYR